MFNMRRTREKVVATVVDNAVALLEQSDVTGLGDRVTAEVYDAWRQLLQQCCNIDVIAFLFSGLLHFFGVFSDETNI